MSGGEAIVVNKVGVGSDGCPRLLEESMVDATLTGSEPSMVTSLEPEDSSVA